MALDIERTDHAAWTAIMTRLVPRAADVLDLSRPAGAQRTFGGALVSLIGAAGLAVLVTLALLAAGTLFALAVRGLLEAAAWSLAIVG